MLRESKHKDNNNHKLKGKLHKTLLREDIQDSKRNNVLLQLQDLQDNSLQLNNSTKPPLHLKQCKPSSSSPHSSKNNTNSLNHSIKLLPTNSRENQTCLLLTSATTNRPLRNGRLQLNNNPKKNDPSLTPSLLVTQELLVHLCLSCPHNSSNKLLLLSCQIKECSSQFRWHLLHHHPTVLKRIQVHALCLWSRVLMIGNSSSNHHHSSKCSSLHLWKAV